jgi:ABC-2 type transport system ATP-binding protein
MLQVENLTKHYGTTTAIRGVSFEVARGEVVGFLGPNGAGKTTTMRILTGSLGASEGRALVDGVDVFEDPRAVKRKVGYLPEVPPLYGAMPVRDYVAFAAKLKGVKDARGAADAALGRVGLKDVGHRIIDHLSKGYRQRVGLAQALVHDPEVLILDEPTSGLDPAQRVEIRELLAELAAGERTIVLSTHVLAEVEALCGRVIIINRGRVVARSRMDELGGERQAVAIKLAAPDDGAPAALGAVEGVAGVEALGGGRFRVRCEGDRRAALAEVAVRWGLLELSAEEGLEAHYLRLTASDTATSAADTDTPAADTASAEEEGE